MRDVYLPCAEAYVLSTIVHFDGSYPWAMRSSSGEDGLEFGDEYVFSDVYCWFESRAVFSLTTCSLTCSVTSVVLTG